MLAHPVVERNYNFLQLLLLQTFEPRLCKKEIVQNRVNYNLSEFQIGPYDTRQAESIRTKPGGDLNCPFYGIVPFLGYTFHDKVRIYKYGFQQFFNFPDLWV